MTICDLYPYDQSRCCIACDKRLPPNALGFCSRACALAQQRKVFGAPLVELAADRARPIASVHREQFEKAMRRAWTEKVGRG